MFKIQLSQMGLPKWAYITAHLASRGSLHSQFAEAKPSVLMVSFILFN